MGSQTRFLWILAALSVACVAVVLWNSSRGVTSVPVVPQASNPAEAVLPWTESTDEDSSPPETTPASPDTLPWEPLDLDFGDEALLVLPFDGVEDGSFLAALRTYYPANVDPLLDDAMLEDLEHYMVDYYGWLLTRDLEYHAKARRRTFGEKHPTALEKTTLEESEAFYRLMFPAEVERIYILCDPLQVQIGGLDQMIMGPELYRSNPHTLKTMREALNTRGQDADHSLIARVQMLAKTSDGDYHWSQIYLTWSEERQHFLAFSHRSTRLLHPESDILTIKNGRKK